MNKNLFGVIIPLVLIVLIIVLSISNIGFKTDKDFVKSVNYNDLFKEGLIKQINLAAVTVENDFFLPRSFELPRYFACLYDKDQKTSAEQLFAQWDPVEVDKSELYYDQPSPVDISWFDKKQINLVAQSRGPYYKLEPYIEQKNATDYSKEFDQILLVELPEDNYGRGCYDLNFNDVSNAIKIEILK